jgi:hypothetical protein
MAHQRDHRWRGGRAEADECLGRGVPRARLRPIGKSGKKAWDGALAIGQTRQAFRRRASHSPALIVEKLDERFDAKASARVGLEY